MAWHSRSGILTCLHACLPSQILGEIWALADDENTGFLTKDQFYAVCRMIGHAQHGVQDINPALLKKGASLSLHLLGIHAGHVPVLLPSVPPDDPADQPDRRHRHRSSPLLTH